MTLDVSDVMAVAATVTGRRDLPADVPLADLALDSVEIVALLYELEDLHHLDLGAAGALLNRVGGVTLAGLAAALNETTQPEGSTT